MSNQIDENVILNYHAEKFMWFLPFWYWTRCREFKMAVNGDGRYCFQLSQRGNHPNTAPYNWRQFVSCWSCHKGGNHCCMRATPGNQLPVRVSWSSFSSLSGIKTAPGCQRHSDRDVTTFTEKVSIYGERKNRIENWWKRVKKVHAYCVNMCYLAIYKLGKEG